MSPVLSTAFVLFATFAITAFLVDALVGARRAVSKEAKASCTRMVLFYVVVLALLCFFLSNAFYRVAVEHVSAAVFLICAYYSCRPSARLSPRVVRVLYFERPYAWYVHRLPSVLDSARPKHQPIC